MLGYDAEESEYGVSLFTYSVLKPFEVTPGQKQQGQASISSSSSHVGSVWCRTRWSSCAVISVPCRAGEECLIPMLSMKEDDNNCSAPVTAENPQGALDRATDGRGSGTGSFGEECEGRINEIDIELWNMPSVSTVKVIAVEMMIGRIVSFFLSILFVH